MKKLAIDLYKEGYNCCEAIIMSANKKYNLDITKDMLKFVSPINNGMGIGSLCSAIIGGIMVIGYIFEKKCAPEHSSINHIRMKFINSINCELKVMNCSQICRMSISKGNCINVISIIAGVLDKIISDYK